MGSKDTKWVRRIKRLSADNPWAGDKGGVKIGDQAFIGYEAIRFLETKLKPGATVIELGSGKSTHLLVKLGYEVYAVEDKEQYLNKVPGATYVHAPLVGYDNTDLGRTLVWYDARVLRSELPADYDALIIDGPEHRKMGRYGACFYHRMFRSDRPILIDDLQEPFVYMMALNLAMKTGANNIDINITNGPKIWGWINKKKGEQG